MKDYKLLFKKFILPMICVAIVVLSVGNLVQNYNDNSSSIAGETTEESQSTATIRVKSPSGTKEYRYSFYAESLNAHTVVMAMAAENPDFDIRTKSPNINETVVSVNGLEAKENESKWNLIINGLPVELQVNELVLGNADVLEFEYIEI